MNQTCLYLWYPLSHIQWDICDQHNHQPELMDQDSFLSFFLRGPFMKYGLYQYGNMAARRGAQFVLAGMPTVCWKPNIAYILSIKNLNRIPVSENICWNQNCLLSKYYLSLPKTRYIGIFCLLNYFWVGNSWVKVEASLMLHEMV